ncbi:MAG: nucleotidyltransferase domain-containing protein [Candidatus Methanomethyliaceae archaeon]|nr:nucleotidyltransferase domain-containing protein [Candidatus Methanomethyliaceae archaeon]MDW7970634.1 nucleotidyltransferase domain-containing protein [Nitrososphaerota archaeon]
MLSRAYIEREIRRYLRSLPINVKFAILFGSSLSGERLRDSDIDLIIISEDFKGMPFERRMLILQKYWKHKILLEAFGFTEEEFERLKSKSLVVQEAMEKGKIILIRKKDKSSDSLKQIGPVD